MTDMTVEPTHDMANPSTPSSADVAAVPPSEAAAWGEIIDGFYVLPRSFLGASTEIAAAAELVRSSYFATDEKAPTRWAEAAARIAQLPSRTPADVAVKILHGLFDIAPAHHDGLLAADVSSLPTDNTLNLLLGAATDVVALPAAAPVADTEEWDAALDAHHKAWALWDVLGDNYSNEEANAVSAVAHPALGRLMSTRAPSLAALIVKMEQARIDGTPIADEDWDAVLADVRALAAREA
jgi:hypothetical protein